MAAFVLGNGLSRLTQDVDQLLALGSVYGCNALWRSHQPTVLVATDQPIARVIQDSGYARSHRFYTRRPLPDSGAQLIPKAYHGFSSGPVALALAALDGHQRIYMLGFDLGGDHLGQFNNVYASTEFYKPLGSPPTFTGNWVRQVQTVARDFADRQFYRVFGATTAAIAEFDRLGNLANLDQQGFKDLINNPKDL